MNLLVIGDHSSNDPTIIDTVYENLDIIHSTKKIKSLVTFNEEGVDETAIDWAFDNSVSFSVYDASKSSHPLNGNRPPNIFLRRIVNDYSIDSFCFMFLSPLLGENKAHRANIRWLYNRASRCFKHNSVYTTHKNPPK